MEGRHKERYAGATLAAASLLNDPIALKPLVPTLLKANENAGTGEASAYLDLLLATVYIRLKDASNASAASAGLLKRYPNSMTTIRLAGEADEVSKDWQAWKTLLEVHPHVNPADRDLILESAAEAEAEGDISRARSVYRPLFDSGHAKPEDYNSDARLSLFQDKVDDPAIAEAQAASLGQGQQKLCFPSYTRLPECQTRQYS